MPTRLLNRAIRHLLAFGAMALASTSTQSAELKGYIYKCPDSPTMCYWHKAVVAPPTGWMENEPWTQRHRALTLLPNGENRRDLPLIYVRAHHGDKEQDLASYISIAQERWKKRQPDSTIEPLPDLERAGKPTLKMFLYKNPSIPEQAFELTAFMKDNNSAPDTNPADMYFFQAVLISPSMTELEKARPAFLELLRRL